MASSNMYLISVINCSLVMSHYSVMITPRKAAKVAHRPGVFFLSRHKGMQESSGCEDPFLLGASKHSISTEHLNQASQTSKTAEHYNQASLSEIITEHLNQVSQPSIITKNLHRASHLKVSTKHLNQASKRSIIINHLNQAS